MRTYYVLWTYIANFSSLLHVNAESPKDAVERTTGLFNSDFRTKGTVYVFENPPVLVSGKRG